MKSWTVTTHKIIAALPDYLDNATQNNVLKYTTRKNVMNKTSCMIA